MSFPTRKMLRVKYRDGTEEYFPNCRFIVPDAHNVSHYAIISQNGTIIRNITFSGSRSIGYVAGYNQEW